jgi:hypothetical protein
MNAPIIRQNTNIINVCIPFRIPICLSANTRVTVIVECGIADEEKPRWVSHVVVRVGAMSVDAQLAATAGLGPCRIWAQGRTSNVVTARTYMYYGPVPTAVRGVRQVEDMVTWNKVECTPAVTGYIVEHNCSSGSVEGDKSGSESLTPLPTWRHIGCDADRCIVRICAVNLNGRGEITKSILVKNAT